MRELCNSEEVNIGSGERKIHKEFAFVEEKETEEKGQAAFSTEKRTLGQEILWWSLEISPGCLLFALVMLVTSDAHLSSCGFRV